MSTPQILDVMREASNKRSHKEGNKYGHQSYLLICTPERSRIGLSRREDVGGRSGAQRRTAKETTCQQEDA